MDLYLLLPPVLGYFFGAIPFGLLVGLFGGVDVRTQGSKNIGATNVSRVVGKRWGAITLLCDCLKGLVPVLVAAMVLPDDVANRELLIACTGVAAVLGHMFSVYLRFTGGKGVATGLGVFLYLSPVALGISLVVFVVSVAVSGFVSVGSLLASGLMPLWLYLLGASPVTISAAALIALLIWIKHHENISRLVKKEEKSWRKNSKEEK